MLLSVGLLSSSGIASSSLALKNADDASFDCSYCSCIIVVFIQIFIFPKCTNFVFPNPPLHTATTSLFLCKIDVVTFACPRSGGRSIHVKWWGNKGFQSAIVNEIILWKCRNVMRWMEWRHCIITKNQQMLTASHWCDSSWSQTDPVATHVCHN